MATLDDLIQKLQTYLPPIDLDLVRRAYAFAAEAHAGQKRKSGEDYVVHPLAAAITLAEMGLDVQSIVTALLHDVPEDTKVPLEKVQEEFGPEIARLVDGVTKLSQIEWGNLEERQAESLRKMFLAMAEDMRVVLIKLADRLHNVSTLDYLSAEKRQKIAQETLEIYAPLASRLGIWQMKWQLEDYAFRHLSPQKYREIVRILANQSQGREHYLEQAIAVLKEALTRAGIPAQLYGRAKHVYSIYRKMQRKDCTFDQIYDLLAVRVIVSDLSQCYEALGVVHSLWYPIPGEFDDYIAVPKENLYRSLHTALIALQGQPLEVQIRTEDMHRTAEYGVAAHWRYKEGTRQDANFESKVAWLRQLMDWRKEIVDAQDFVDSFKTDIFKDQVYVFTPKNDIIDLPAGATPVDFAYRIHTDIGHRCRGARVNGRLVGLDYRLQNGDRVEIMPAKTGGPSRDWLNPNLGYTASSHAREKIRQWFKKQARAENIAHGKEELDRELKALRLEDDFELVMHIFEEYQPAPGDSMEKAQAHWQEDLRHLGYGPKQIAEIIDFFRLFAKRDDLYLAIGDGDVTAPQVSARLLFMEEPEPLLIPQVAPWTSTTPPGIQVMGVDDLLTNLGRCCNPVPGDDIVGYVTRGRGVTVHRRDCHNMLKFREPERLVTVDWGRARQQGYAVPIRIEATDREGLLRDVAALVAEEKVNLAAAGAQVHKDRRATITATLEVSDTQQLSRILAKIEKIKDVRSARRDVGKT